MATNVHSRTLHRHFSVHVSRAVLWRLLAAGGLLAVTTPRLIADITGPQVLVVYNSTSGEATTLKDVYLAAHPDIPSANILDLNNPALLTADLTPSQFITDIRDPIRTFLLQPAAPTPEEIIAIVLIRPLPHRLLDSDAGLVGDSPGNAASEFNAGDATYASVDAELVLLWQDLYSTEAGATMDSLSDNVIVNPYHQSAAAINTFSRTAIQTAKTFNNRQNAAWTLGGSGATKLTPGDMYLVCRIDGTTLADAEAVIDRAADLRINKALVRILLDEYDVSTNKDIDDDPLFSLADPFLAGDDFEEARNLLVAGGWDVRYDGTFNFIDSTEETTPLIAYSSYGENHDAGGLGEDPPGIGTYIDGFVFPPGALFNTLESFNGRAFNGLGTLFGQEQIADFIATGGAFAIGQVFEPFSFTLPDNEFMIVNMLSGQLTWAEAAYAATPALSWQQIVIGDPLAKPVILNDTGLPLGDLDGNGQADGNDISQFVLILLNGLAGYHAAFPALDPVARGDFNADFQVDIADLPGFVAALIAP